MQTNARAGDGISRLVAGGDAGLAHLSDGELLANTRGLAGRSNEVFAALLAHLAEVEARGLHRTRACASLYTYCIYELRMSEDAAARRAGAAKLVKRFPLLLGAIASGELHLTGVLMLGPHLTAANILEVLGRAKFRTKKELAKLVRELHPLPLVADLIEPLRVEPKSLRRPTWAEFGASMSPVVRELPAGERPCDWANDAREVSVDSPAPARVELPSGELPAGERPRDWANDALEGSPAPARVELPFGELLPGELPTGELTTPDFRPELPPITAPQQYQMQFSTTEEHVHLVERAKALLTRQAPGRSLGELHLQAMRLLVAALEKQKFAMTERPQTQRKRVARSFNEPVAVPGRKEPTTAPKRRHVPARVRRAVFERDEGRCTYVDERGERCRETSCLELHHRQAFGRGGAESVANLTLHCRAHNGLAAEQDFGREHMAERRDPLRHESLASAERAGGAVEQADA